MISAQAISVAGLTKKYGDVEAVRGIDFEVSTGEVFGLLGPNGAGKTTTVEILEGIRQRTGGDVRVLDFDPDKQKTQLKDRIGVCLQATNLPDKIKVIEALELFGSLYSRMLKPDDLLERLQLEDKRERLLLHSVGRTEAAPRHRPRPHQRPVAALSRRAHHRPRPSGASRNPRPHQGAALRKAHHPADHPLHSGSREHSATAWPSSMREKSSPWERRANCRTAARESPQSRFFATARSQASPCRSFQTHCKRGLARMAAGSPSLPHGRRARWSKSSSGSMRKRIGLEDVHLARPTLEDVFIELTGKRLRE